ncbi:MAG: 50S ribosomal protein L11 methyltransferase [Oscillospiraceae bacterium]|nr:50S ribosomal protein L11 methyltransferase [Oscillospiraceae bacterium]
MDWLEITVNTTPDEISALSDRLEDLGVSGLIIENEAEYNDFLENNRKFWDYVDEDFEKSIKNLCRIKFYLEDSPDGYNDLERIKSGINREPDVKQVKDEDWENNWKEFYKPLEVGEKLLIVPQWEEAPDACGRNILRLDPGLIFGTGSHPTTKMCLRALETVEPEGKDILDLGCGSGILAIAGIVLGAKSAMGCDIDPKAPEIASANAALNGINGDIFSVTSCDVLKDRYMQKKYEAKKFHIVLANIVADVILALTPLVKSWLRDGGYFITSGIIDGRENEIENKLIENGFTVIEHYNEDDWHCFLCR